MLSTLGVGGPSFATVCDEGNKIGQNAVTYCMDSPTCMSILPYNLANDAAFRAEALGSGVNLV